MLRCWTGLFRQFMVQVSLALLYFLLPFLFHTSFHYLTLRNTIRASSSHHCTHVFRFRECEHVRSLETLLLLVSKPLASQSGIKTQSILIGYRNPSFKYQSGIGTLSIVTVFKFLVSKPQFYKGIETQCNSGIETHFTSIIRRLNVGFSSYYSFEESSCIPKPDIEAPSLRNIGPSISNRQNVQFGGD